MIKSNPNNYQVLSDEDLKANKFTYDLETLEWNVKFSPISLKVLVRTQKLSPYICAKYVVFGGRDGPYGYGKYACGSEDSWISTDDALYHQPHITKDEMSEAHKIADAEDEIEARLEQEAKENKTD